MRLIDADKLWTDTTSTIECCEDFLEVIERQTIIDTSKELICSVNVTMDTDEVVERLKERGWEPVKHGRWKYNIILGWCSVGTEATADYVCSVCGWHTKMPTAYCPNCGAKMDEVSE